MSIPLRITFRGVPPTESLESTVRDKAAWLERFHQRIASCHVVIEAPPQRQRKGANYRVNVKLAVPGDEITASRESGRNHAHEDLHVALRDTFAAAVRQLEEHAQVRRGDVKTHAAERRTSPAEPSQEE